MEKIKNSRRGVGQIVHTCTVYKHCTLCCMYLKLYKVTVTER